MVGVTLTPGRAVEVDRQVLLKWEWIEAGWHSVMLCTGCSAWGSAMGLWATRVVAASTHT